MAYIGPMLQHNTVIGSEIRAGTLTGTPAASLLAPHWLYIYAHRTTDNAWTLAPPHLVIVAGGRTIWLPMISRR